MHPIAKHALPSAFHTAALTCVDVFLSRELPEISTDGKPPRQHHRCAISSQAACRSWLLRTRGRFPASAASRGRGQPPTVMLPPQSPFRTATAFLGKSGKRHRWCEAVPRRGTRWRRKRGLPAPRYLLVPRTTGTFPAALRDPWRPCEASPDSEAFPSGYQAPMPGGRLAPPPRFPLPAEKPPPVRSSKDAPPDESRTTAPFHVQKPEKGRLCEEFPKLASHGLAQLPAIQRNREKTAGNAKPSRSRPRGLPPGRSRGGAAWPAAQVAAWPAAWGAAWPAAWVADCAASLGLWRGPNRHQPPSGVARGPYSRLPRRRMTIGATNKLPAKTNVFAGSWLMVLMCSSRQSVSRGWPRAHPDTGAGLGGRVPDGRHGMRRTARGLELRAGLHRAPHAAAAGPNCAGRGCSPGAASRARPGTRRTATPTP